MSEEYSTPLHQYLLLYIFYIVLHIIHTHTHQYLMMIFTDIFYTHTK